jgi:hypothetical protein
MPGIIEDGAEPEGPGIAAVQAHLAVWWPQGGEDVVDPEELGDRLRFMGVAEEVVLEFEERCTSGLRPALRWLESIIDALEEPSPWACDCGEPLVDGGWTGRAIIRCSVCGARWAFDVPSPQQGSQASITGPNEEWLARREAEALAHDAYPPEIVLVDGLPPMPENIEPGQSYPIAAWSDGHNGAVLYAHRRAAGAFAHPGEEYEEEIEHLELNPVDGWVGVSSSGGDWPNPFDPPRQLLDKYKAFVTGVSGSSGVNGDIWFVGGLCADAVSKVEIHAAEENETIDVDPDRRTFLIGSTDPEARVRFLDQSGAPITDHRGRVVEVTLGC